MLGMKHSFSVLNQPGPYHTHQSSFCFQVQFPFSWSVVNLLSGTVPPFDTAHRVLRISGWSEMPRFLHRTVPTNTNNFCAVYDYAGKANIRKGCWNPKRKLGVTTHFSEIINLKFGKKMPHIVLYFKGFFFTIMVV